MTKTFFPGAGVMIGKTVIVEDEYGHNHILHDNNAHPIRVFFNDIHKGNTFERTKENLRLNALYAYMQQSGNSGVSVGISDYDLKYESRQYIGGSGSTAKYDNRQVQIRYTPRFRNQIISYLRKIKGRKYRKRITYTRKVKIKSKREYVVIRDDKVIEKTKPYNENLRQGINGKDVKPSGYEYDQYSQENFSARMRMRHPEQRSRFK